MTHINAITAGVYLFKMEDEANREDFVWTQLTICPRGGFFAQFYREDPRQAKSQIPLGSIEIDYFDDLISALKWDPSTESHVEEEFTIVEQTHGSAEENEEDSVNAAQ